MYQLRVQGELGEALEVSCLAHQKQVEGDGQAAGKEEIGSASQVHLGRLWYWNPETDQVTCRVGWLQSDP